MASMGQAACKVSSARDVSEREVREEKSRSSSATVAAAKEGGGRFFCGRRKRRGIEGLKGERRTGGRFVATVFRARGRMSSSSEDGGIVKGGGAEVSN